MTKELFQLPALWNWNPFHLKPLSLHLILSPWFALMLALPSLGCALVACTSFLCRWLGSSRLCLAFPLLTPLAALAFALGSAFAWVLSVFWGPWELCGLWGLWAPWVCHHLLANLHNLPRLYSSAVSCDGGMSSPPWLSFPAPCLYLFLVPAPWLVHS